MDDFESTCECDENTNVPADEIISERDETNFIFINYDENDSNGVEYQIVSMKSSNGVEYQIVSMKKVIDEIVEDLKVGETLPNLAAELVKERPLNIMVIDLYDYVKGFEVSFYEYGSDDEKFHGIYPYAVSVLEYIRSGQIPYELFDNLYKYGFEVFYDGFVVCKLRIHLGQEDHKRSHFVLLRPSIQTIDAECLMNCKADASLDFNSERAKLIEYYSPDLCLDPDPVVADIVVSNELNQYPFMAYELKRIVMEEKARREKGVQLMKKNKPQESVKNKPKVDDFDWNFRLKDPKPKDIELAKSASKLECKDSIVTYLKTRPMCFPDSFTGSHVEMENFVYTYDRETRDEKVKSVTDKFSISVIDDREIYYCAYQLDEKGKRTRRKPLSWYKIDGREELDKYLNVFTEEELKSSFGRMKITHNRLFDEECICHDGTVTIVRKKLQVPESQVILQYSPPPSDSEDADEEREKT